MDIGKFADALGWQKSDGVFKTSRDGAVWLDSASGVLHFDFVDDGVDLIVAVVHCDLGSEDWYRGACVDGVSDELLRNVPIEDVISGARAQTLIWDGPQ